MSATYAGDPPAGAAGRAPVGEEVAGDACTEAADEAGTAPTAGDAGTSPATGDAGTSPATGDAGTTPAAGKGVALEGGESTATELPSASSAAVSGHGAAAGVAPGSSATGSFSGSAMGLGDSELADMLFFTSQVMQRGGRVDHLAAVVLA